MPVVAHNIVILNSQEAVPKIKHDESVHLKVSAPPVVNIATDVAVMHNPDVVLKPSEYVSQMFRINK